MEMRSRSRNRPSPAMVIASVALSFALAGSAIAGTEVVTRALSKSKVKKIAKKAANKQITARAPGLSVASADRLDGHDSGEFVRKDESFTRNWSCPGSAFYPVDGGAAYSTSASVRTTPGAQLRCPLHLPDGATVTSVRFTIRDTNPSGSAFDCELWRTSMTSSIGEDTQMAETPGSAGTPGDTTLIDTTIENNPIDNADYSYYLQCTLNTLGGDPIGIWGANVGYTVPGG